MYVGLDAHHADYPTTVLTVTHKRRGEVIIHGVGVTKLTYYHKTLILTIRKSKTKATDSNLVTPVPAVACAITQAKPTVACVLKAVTAV